MRPFKLVLGVGLLALLVTLAPGGPVEARKLPDIVHPTVRARAMEITRGLSSERDKAYAIFRFLADNIAYDTDSYFGLKNTQYPSQEPADVLKRKTAVCAGYSKLYEAMATSVGLESKYLTGLARKKLESPGSDRKLAWNAVKIRGKWHLLDCTWGAGTVNHENRRFTRKLDEAWFLMPPEDFAYSHFPVERKWLLTPRPRSQKEFDSLPWLRPAYFSQGVKLKDERRGYHRATDTFDWKLHCPKGYRVWVRLEQEGKELTDLATIIQGKGGTTVRARFPQAGDYVLKLFSSKGKEKLEHIATVCVHAGRGKTGLLPSYRNDFFEFGLKLKDPEKGLYRVKDEVVLQLSRPSRKVRVTANIEGPDGQRPAQMVLVNTKSDKLLEIRARCPDKGRYQLNLFATDKPGDQGTFVASLQMEAQRSRGPFPLLYREFFEKDCELRQGRNGVLRRGESVNFSLSTRGREQLYLRQPSGYYQPIPAKTGSSGTVFQTRFKAEGDEVVISHRKQDGRYYQLMKYEVR